MSGKRSPQTQKPPATMIQVPGAQASSPTPSLTEPLLKSSEKRRQKRQASSLEPTESDSQSSCGHDDGATESISLQNREVHISKRTETTEEETATTTNKNNVNKAPDLTATPAAGAELLTDLTTNELDETVGKFLRRGSLAALLAWLVFVTTALKYAPADSFERLEGAEKHANVTVLFLLLYTNTSRILHMVIRDSGFGFVNSGVMVGYSTVQFIAIVSISLMVFFPTPVIIDPVTGIRSHLVRWAEWVCASFLMTFLVESVDLPVSTTEQQKQRGDGKATSRQKRIPMIAWMHGISIGLSTAAGAISAFCTSWSAWLAVIGVSWILFCSLFVRLYQRYHRLKMMGPGISVEEKEDYDRARYSLKTIAVCTTVWTALAGSWTVIALMAPFASSESFFSNPALVLLSESLFESISKIWYADLLVEIHEVVFDDASRTMRRLEELRNLMAAVWDHSSDILIWGSRSSRGSKLIQGIVSPKGGVFLAENSPVAPNGRCASTLLLEVDPETEEYRCFMIDLSAPITREGAIALRNMNLQQKNKTFEFSEFDGDKNISAIVKLLSEAHCMESRREKTTMCELVSEEGEKLHQCEAKITKLLGADSTLIVIRDISERYQRFETEKKLIEEKTARKKDFEANRFTRHEVKNGILAAIGLVDSIRDSTNKTSSSQSVATISSGEARPAMHSFNSFTDLMQETDGDGEMTSASANDSCSGFEDSYGELDNTLRDILDTIMDHAMSLDVINEEYDVRKERVDVPFVLSTIKRQTTGGPSQARFRLVCEKEPFPVLGLDPRLLRHIYQNALSNASRYGKPNGVIQTIIDYDETRKEFKMDVINEPGPGHEMLTALSREEIDSSVFSQGSRLGSNSFEEEVSEVEASNSSGDGAWIMRKCSNILNGDVAMRFEADRTVLSFWCPAKIVGKTDSRSTAYKEFTRLPPNTWGVVVDDSGIQRKLMDRFLKIAGIASDRRIILGKDSDEIFNFADRVIEILRSNPNDKVLLIADENLDVVDGGALNTTVSGSLCIEQLLTRLEPDERSRFLALVRSANDSSKDLSLYKSRAHGFLLKAPIDRDGVMGVIQPWWVKRFEAEAPTEADPASKNVCSNMSLESDCYDAFHDIVEVIEVIAALCRVGSSKSLRNRWRTIQEKLFALKGDLKSVISSRGAGDDLEDVLADIDSLRSGDFPRDLQQRWLTLETKLYNTINANR